jgi:DHA1 family bicyclomycin/chloramphenicol resistance-like MFS transporter
MSLRRSPRFVALLVLVTVLGPLSMQMFLPALPAIQSAFATSAGTAQLALTAAMLAVGTATLVFGPLSDRFGRKPVLIVGIVFFLAGSVLVAVAASVAVLIAARIIQSGGASAGIVLARAMARDVYGFADSIRVISYLTMAMVVAPTISPALGGLLADSFGWRAIFWALGLVGVAAFVGVAWGLVETNANPVSGGWRGLIEGSRRLLVNRRYVAYAVVCTAAFCVFFSFLAAAPYLMSEVLQRPARDYGFWFMPVAGIFILGTYCSTRLLDRFGPDRLIRAGSIASFIIVAATLVLHALLPLTAPLLFLPAVAFSFVQGFIIPNAQASAINIDPRFAGAGSGLIGFMGMAASATVAQIIAEIADGTVWPMLGFMAGAACLGVVSLPLLRAAIAPKERAETA